jgi:hypothetical protein
MWHKVHSGRFWLLPIGLGVFAAIALVVDPQLAARYVWRDAAVLEPKRIDILRFSATVAAVALFVLALCSRFLRSALGSKLVVFFIPISAILVIGLYKYQFGAEEYFYLRFVQEDGPVEYATFVAFVVSSGLCLLTGLKALKTRGQLIGCFHFLLSAFLLFLGLEEISYGQRIFGFETPSDLATINTQSELNLHNISSLKLVMQDYGPELIFKYGLFGWALTWLLRRFVALWSKFLPTSRQVAVSVELVFPPWYAASYFVPMVVYAYMSAYGVVGSCCSIVWQDQEPAELFLSLGFLVFASAALWRVSYRNGDRAKTL